MKDNLAADTYMYEIIVQTGPMLSHGTESKVGDFAFSFMVSRTSKTNGHQKVCLCLSVPYTI